MSIQVEDENEEVDVYRGTKGWMAPEVGEWGSLELVYSPIMADRWSSGHVILHLLDRVGEEDSYLKMVAGKLKASATQQRPSLPDWHKWLPAPLSDVPNTLKGKGISGSRQDTTDVDGEVMTPPNAKQVRLANS